MDQIEFLSEPESVSMSDDWFEFANKDHFWMRWRYEAVKKIIDRVLTKKERCLEVGCGNGVFKEQIESGYNITVDGCDLNLHALKKIKNSVGRVMVYNIFDLNEKLIGKYDAIFLMDVIEHIKDHQEFMQTVKKHLKPDGFVIINVPALQSLFSNYDTIAGHMRRYNRKSLASLLNQTGFQINKMSYWGSYLYPIAVLRKLMLNFTAKEKTIQKGFSPPNKMADTFLRFLSYTELKGFNPFSNLFGTSLIVVARSRVQ